MEVDILQQLCLGREAGYQVFELATKATKYMEVEVFKENRPASSS
jgi:hypothetical protein